MILFAMAVCSAVTGTAPDGAQIGFASNEYFTFGAAANFTAGIALADFDRDEDLDAVAVNGRHWTQQDYVFLNNGNGRFTVARPLDAELTTGYEPVAADFDNDGDTDILVPRDRTPNRYYENLGPARFAPPVTFGLSGPARGLVVADVDNDGRQDVVVSQRSAPNYWVRFDGRKFGSVMPIDEGSETVRGVSADFNGDGLPDLAFADIGSGGGSVQFNLGKGKFTTPVKLAEGSGQMVDIASGDLDRDGDTDLVLVGIGRNAVLMNENGTFPDVRLFGPDTERSYGVALADLTGDGAPDIAVANYEGPNAVYIQEETGFARVELPEDPESQSYGVAIGDLNGDGAPELVFANSGAFNRIHLNVRCADAEALLRR